MSGQKVMAAMSGGVDSSVTALLLARQGYEVCGGTLLLWQGENPQEQSGCCALPEIEDARRVCARLGVEHYTFNLKDVFCREVIDRFLGTLPAESRAVFLRLIKNSSPKEKFAAI